MATWTDNANKDIDYIVSHCNLSNDQKSEIHSKINKWADVVGRLLTNTWTIGNYRITATAESHEVLKVDVDM